MTSSPAKAGFPQAKLATSSKRRMIYQRSIHPPLSGGGFLECCYNWPTMVWKIGIFASLTGFLAIGALTATHPGFAIRLANYIFWLLLVSVIGSLLYEK